MVIDGGDYEEKDWLTHGECGGGVFWQTWRAFSRCLLRLRMLVKCAAVFAICLSQAGAIGDSEMVLQEFLGRRQIRVVPE